MSRIALKRREPLVKFLRRAARGHLDAADAALRAGAQGGKRSQQHVARAHRELLRLRALLQFIRGPLAPAVFAREHGAVQRLLRRITPHAGPGDAATTRAIAACVGTAASTKKVQEPARRPAAGPALLRALADLAEIRVRAAHWHVPDAGFEALAPAMRRAWRLAARPATRTQGPTPAARADAALTLHDQLRCVQRMWPEAIDAPRRLARRLASDAARLAALDALAARAAQPTAAGVDAQWHTRLTDAQTQAAADVHAAAGLLRAETPAAFTRRAAGYWDRWRQDTG